MSSAPRPAGRLRVVQWATGNIGAHALRAVIEHPDLELVGVYVYAPQKSGLDAGALCDLGPTAVAATDDIDEILSLGADCVLYTPRRCDLDEVARILSSGSNIVTTRHEFHHPSALDPAARLRIEAACHAGNASVHSTGSSPGFVTEALPLVLTSIQRRLELLQVEEYADLSQRASPELLFDGMGFGRLPGAFDGARLDHIRTSFGSSLRHVADTLSIPVDVLEVAGEFATARRRITIAAGTLDAGTVAGQRMTVTALRSGSPALRFRATWYCTPDLDPAWDVRDTGWRVSVVGDAPLDVDIRFPVPLEDLGAVTPGYTANRAVNAIPAVCRAPAGIRTTAELGQVFARLG